jgi:lysozyme
MNTVTTEGIDVSAYQKKVNWKAEAARGVHFAYFRAADGPGRIDALAAAHASGAQEARVLTGPYLFFRADRDPVEQARILLGAHTLFSDLPPALDCEESSDGGLPREKVRQAVNRCIEEVEKFAGRCVVYTCVSWWDNWMGGADRQEDLWCAHYGVDQPMLPRGWTKRGYVIHQYTGTGSCGGISGPCDKNRFLGDHEKLRKWARGEC